MLKGCERTDEATADQPVNGDGLFLNYIHNKFLRHAFHSKRTILSFIINQIIKNMSEVSLDLSTINYRMEKLFQDSDLHSLIKNKEFLIKTGMIGAQIIDTPNILTDKIQIDQNVCNITKPLGSLDSIRRQIKNNEIRKGIKITYRIPIEGNIDEFKRIYQSCLKTNIKATLEKEFLVVTYEFEGSLSDEDKLQEIKSKAKKDLGEIIERFNTYTSLVQQHNENLSDYVSNIYERIVNEKKRKQELDDKLNPFK